MLLSWLGSLLLISTAIGAKPLELQYLEARSHTTSKLAWVLWTERVKGRKRTSVRLVSSRGATLAGADTETIKGQYGFLFREQEPAHQCLHLDGGEQGVIPLAGLSHFTPKNWATWSDLRHEREELRERQAQIPFILKQLRAWRTHAQEVLATHGGSCPTVDPARARPALACEHTERSDLGLLYCAVKGGLADACGFLAGLLEHHGRDADAFRSPWCQQRTAVCRTTEPLRDAKGFVELDVPVEEAMRGYDRWFMDQEVARQRTQAARDALDRCRRQPVDALTFADRQELRRRRCRSYESDVRARERGEMRSRKRARDDSPFGRFMQCRDRAEAACSELNEEWYRMQPEAIAQCTRAEEVLARIDALEAAFVVRRSETEAALAATEEAIEALLQVPDELVPCSPLPSQTPPLRGRQCPAGLWFEQGTEGLGSVDRIKNRDIRDQLPEGFIIDHVYLVDDTPVSTVAEMAAAVADGAETLTALVTRGVWRGARYQTFSLTEPSNDCVSGP